MRDRHVLITGGTGGLGRGVTTIALAQGAALTLTYVDSTEVEQLKATLTPSDLQRIHFIAADLSDEASVISLINHHDRLDATIHLVGGFSMGATPDFSYADWRREIELNLHTTFLVCKHSLRKMLAQDYGRIVTIGSRGAEQPAGQLAAYCAAKAGVVALTKAIADEAKGTGVTANVVLPSVIDTPANRNAMGDAQASQWVTPASLGNVICFLASEAAKDIRGAAVPVYGNA
ncbi:MAG: 3-oxoacyl-ACP reductase FabG [Leptolyngbya sp. SIO1D8]|nr:3-oxoacyl-ACP reductase FabG [Leptolyngbya sp. SIO1D8]